MKHTTPSEGEAIIKLTSIHIRRQKYLMGSLKSFPSILTTLLLVLVHRSSYQDYS